MPIRKPVPVPPFSIVRASHIEYGATDLARAKSYWVDVLGYLMADETSDALYLRGLEERNHHSVVLRRSKGAAVASLGFKLASEEDLDKAARYFGERQLPNRFV
ncbi:MAG: VOC family protein, partial [Hyphomicrobiales bacterium]|nr:VOC family protein [Hyphomicrobiales bacterium]